MLRSRLESDETRVRVGANQNIESASGNEEPKYQTTSRIEQSNCLTYTTVWSIDWWFQNSQPTFRPPPASVIEFERHAYALKWVYACRTIQMSNISETQTRSIMSNTERNVVETEL